MSAYIFNAAAANDEEEAEEDGGGRCNLFSSIA